MPALSFLSVQNLSMNIQFINIRYIFIKEKFKNSFFFLLTCRLVALPNVQESSPP